MCLDRIFGVLKINYVSWTYVLKTLIGVLKTFTPYMGRTTYIDVLALSSEFRVHSQSWGHRLKSRTCQKWNFSSFGIVAKNQHGGRDLRGQRCKRYQKSHPQLLYVVWTNQGLPKGTEFSFEICTSCNGLVRLPVWRYLFLSHNTFKTPYQDVMSRRSETLSRHFYILSRHPIKTPTSWLASS